MSPDSGATGGVIGNDALPPPCDASSRRAVGRIVSRASSSFRWAMALLPRERRETMYAIYAYCRVLDDIADGDETADRKRFLLDAWRKEIGHMYAGRPHHPVTRALARPTARYRLPHPEFERIIEGMETDAEPVRAPPLDTLLTYCRNVAGSVGVLTLATCGLTGPTARELAVAQGEAMQLTNVLRDVSEDAMRGRLYLPAELLAEAGIDDRAPEEVLAHPRIAKPLRALAALAEERFERAAALRNAIVAPAGADLRPARAMADGYRHLLRKLTRQGAAVAHRRIGLTSWEKLWVAARLGLPRPW
ncbi:MAG: presqualene diphosphate synthase HpnD [Acetobacterales bacterium]